MSKKVLLHNQPLYDKLNKIFQLMDELGISIETNSYYTLVTDSSDKRQWQLEDLDDNQRVTTFPHPFEFKLVKYE